MYSRSYKISSSPKLSLLFIFIITIGSSSASISYDDIPTFIFANGPRTFEYRVAASTENVKVFFNRDDVSVAVVSGVVATRFMPYIGKFTKLVPMMFEMIVEQSDWRKLFTKAIVEETMREVGESEVRYIEASVQTIRSKIKLLSDENTDNENRKTVASIIHTELNRIVNLFELKSSLFRKYPLVGAPLLIHLASLVAAFTPIAIGIIPLEAMNPSMACKMSDLLLDYRIRTVMARLHKLHAQISIFESLVKWTYRPSSLIAVMSMPYNKYGYNSTNPPVINCGWGCNSDEMGVMEACIMDKFSKHTYHGRNIGSDTCLKEYGALLRHRVEELFPVEELESLCTDQRTRRPTGLGWLTFNLLNTHFYGDIGDKESSVQLPPDCNPFIKLFVNGELIKESPTRADKTLHDVDITYETPKISINSTIKLEVWDAGSMFWSSPKLMFSTEGDVESFLTDPVRKSANGAHMEAQLLDEVNSIETMSFWLDELK